MNCIHIRFVTRQRCGEFYPTSRLYVAVWISNCAWLLLHFLVAYCIILYRPSGWECRTCGVGDNTVIVGGGRRLPWFERVLCEFVRVEGLLLCKSLGHGIFSQIPSKHPLLPRYVNSILRSIYRSSNTPIWTQTPLSKVGVLPLCRMGCLCSGTFWTGRNSWRKKSISMEFQNFHTCRFQHSLLIITSYKPVGAAPRGWCVRGPAVRQHGRYVGRSGSRRRRRPFASRRNDSRIVLR